MNWRFSFPLFALFATAGVALGGGVGFALFWLLNLAMNFYPPTI
jgi:hypothetical protein